VLHKPGSRHTRGTRESAVCQNSHNSGRAPALDRTKAWKTPSNSNGFWQSFRAWATPRTLDKSGSPLTLRTSPLSLLYKEWTWEHYRKLNLTFFRPSAGRSTGVFIGGLSRCFGWKWGSEGPLVRPARPPARVAGHPSFMVASTLGIWYPVHRPSLTRWQSGIWKGANTWSAGPHFGSVGPGLCATSSPHVIFSMTMPYFRHIEDMNVFWSIWCFSVIRCSWNGRSTKLVELVSNKHISSISWMKFRYVGGKYMHFMTANRPWSITLGDE
jgi:hypothetical protein